jgi:hypothetical protein
MSKFDQNLKIGQNMPQMTPNGPIDGGFDGPGPSSIHWCRPLLAVTVSFFDPTMHIDTLPRERRHGRRETSQPSSCRRRSASAAARRQRIRDVRGIHRDEGTGGQEEGAGEA